MNTISALKKSKQIFNTVGRLLLQEIGIISAPQRDTLEELFAKDEYPTKSKIHEIAEKLGLGGETVNNWFRRKRAKARSGMSKKKQSIGEFVDIDEVLVSIKMVVHFFLFTISG